MPGHTVKRIFLEQTEWQDLEEKNDKSKKRQEAENNNEKLIKDIFSQEKRTIL